MPVTVNNGDRIVVTGVRYEDIAGTTTMVLIDTEGSSYPVCVNESDDMLTIGPDWEYDTGISVEFYGGDWVDIIGDDGRYVNPHLIEWLMQFGATFVDTYPSLVVYDVNGGINNAIRSYMCVNNSSGLNYLALDASVTLSVSTPDSAGDEVFDCEYQMIPYQTDADNVIVVDLSRGDVLDSFYTNALICKALGMNPIYLK